MEKDLTGGVGVGAYGRVADCGLRIADRTVERTTKAGEGNEPDEPSVTLAPLR